jgi:hypothetical protein
VRDAYTGEPALAHGRVHSSRLYRGLADVVSGQAPSARWMVNSMLLIAMAYAAMRAVQGVKVEVVAELVAFIQLIQDGRSAGPPATMRRFSRSQCSLPSPRCSPACSFFVGVQLAIFVPLLVATVMLFQLYSGWFVARAASAAARAASAAPELAYGSSRSGRVGWHGPR